MKKNFARKSFKYLLVMVIFSLLVFLNPKGFFTPFQFLFSSAAYPFQKVSHMAGVKLGNTKDFLLSIGSLKKENRNLLVRTVELEAENEKLRDIEKENEFLRKQIDILPKERFELIPSYVVSQDPNGLGNWIEIDKGSNEGVEEGMALVVSKSVMLGKVEEVWTGRSRVMLVTNPKSAINVVSSANGSRGIASGEYGLGIVVDKILQTDTVSVGDTFITSGLGGGVPRGLTVGVTQEVRPSEDYLFQQATISMPVNVSRLNMVFVVKKEK